MRLIGHGPKEKWEADIEKMSRTALVDMVQRLLFRFIWIGYALPPDELAELIVDCKKHGRWMNAHAATQRLLADPDGYIRACMRKSKAATKAANRRKNEKRRSTR